MRWPRGVMGRAPEVLIVGSGRLAADAEAALRRQRPVARIDRVDGIGHRLRAVSTLILTADAYPEQGWNQVFDEIWARPAQGPRILVLSDAREPEPPAVQRPAAAAAGRIERLVVEHRAARLLLARWPLHYGCDPTFDQQVHLIIAGRTPLADALLVHALRVAHYSDRQPVMTLLGHAPERWRRDFAAAHPAAESIGRLRFRPLDDPALAGEPLPCGVVVCVEPAEVGLNLVEPLLRRIVDQQGVAPPVLFDVGDAEPAGDLSDWDGLILPFAHRRMVLTPEVLLDGRGDEMARVIHDHYRDTSAAQGRDPNAEPASRPWSRLADSYRSANRHQADHIWAKLAVTDCRAVPEDLVESFAFAPAEVERLAVIEHARWAADRYLDGWRYAPRRDNAAKHHPQLIPYAELSGPMKDLDRFAVRLVPALLARSGLGLVRMLIVGVPETKAAVGSGAAAADLQPWVDRVLQRLIARYPDRGLVVAATLADSASRLLAHRALHLAQAGLFLLCPRPLSATLAAQPDAHARRELLELAARAERRIPLPAVGDLDRWLAARAEILLQFSSGQAVAGLCGGSVAPGRKCVRVDPDRGLDWNFEY